MRYKTWYCTPLSASIAAPENRGIEREADSKRYPATVGASDCAKALMEPLTPSIMPIFEGSEISVAKDCRTGIANCDSTRYVMKNRDAVIKLWANAKKATIRPLATRMISKHRTLPSLATTYGTAMNAKKGKNLANA